MPEENKIPDVKTQSTQQFWLDEIDKSKSYFDKQKFHLNGHKIIERYRDDERNTRARLDSRYNILYSNTETIQPVLLSEAPECDVRAQDTTSMPARRAAKMLEDVLNIDIKRPETMKALKACVKDLLLPGMGVLRVRYNPLIVERTTTRIETDEDTLVETEYEETEEKVMFENLVYDYVHWNDVYFPEYRTWDVLPWIAFRGLYSYDAAVEEFGPSVASKLDYVFRDKSARTPSEQDESNTSDSTKFGLAEVWEIWDKTNRKVVWISKSRMLDAPIRIDDDPLELDDFYPVPEPLFSSTTSDQVLPVPLFLQYEDLANELDDVTTRIRRIVDNLRRRGVYDAQFHELEQLADSGDNNFIPIKNFAQLQGSGGLKAVMDSEDITTQAGVLEVLYKERNEIINAIYQIMGYGDILRGVSDPRETATAQRIKGRFGTLRISEMQREVQRFIRDALRIGGQIVINKFSDKTIALQTSVPIEEVAVYTEILEQSEPASVMVDVQTDSTIAADDVADKESIIEFTAAVNEFVVRTPAMVQVLGLQATSELLLSLLKKFKMGRDIEQAVMDRVREAAIEQEQAKNGSS
jgi:hypothetical protein